MTETRLQAGPSCSARARLNPEFFTSSLLAGTDKTMIFKVPKSWPVFVLEDTADRIAWFRRQIPHAVIATSCDEALRILSTREFKIVFLDHDLGFLDAAYPERLHGNGKEVARFLARTAFPGVVVIHSKHEAGANAMKAYVPQASLAPFGTFEIEISEVFASEPC